jgi:hypothetical protein
MRYELCTGLADVPRRKYLQNCRHNGMQVVALWSRVFRCRLVVHSRRTTSALCSNVFDWFWFSKDEASKTFDYITYFRLIW